jgi:hypothetical protein
MLAGRRVPDDDVRELARLVDDPIRGVLEKGLELGTVIVALTVPDREHIIRALDDPQTIALAELYRGRDQAANASGTSDNRCESLRGRFVSFHGRLQISLSGDQLRN